MIHRLIELSLRNRGLVIALYLGLAAWGYWALLRTPIDAIPDLSENQVIVFTDWTGRSPQEVEDQVTYPLVTNLQGLPGVRVVRASSAFSFSMINIIFEDNVDLYWARTRVLERLNLVTAQLPQGVTPTLGPDATGVGQIFWYTLESDQMNLRDLRSLQDWFVRYQLNSVPGVAEVASVGGYVQQYQVDVDPNKLRSYALPLSMVVEAVERSNNNVGGNVVEQAGQWSVVRGVGLIQSPADIENVVLTAQNGIPIYVKNVANVKIGNAFRVGALDKNGKEAVGGVVIARYGVNTLEVIDAIKQKIASIQSGLPAGVHVVPFYDRTQLINRATHTLKRALIEELILVTLAHILFLAHFRSILIVTLPLPLAVLLAFLFMYYMGMSSNLMSLSGIAIAIGVLVDAGIVVTENAFRFIEQRKVDPKDRQLIWQTVLESTRLVGRPIFFSMAIIILAFIPVFSLTGEEGKLFHPLAFTKTFAMVGATIIAVTLVPVLCTLLLRGKFHAEQANPVMRALHFIYRPVLRFALNHRVLTVALAVLLFSGAIFLATGIGKEFMPPLNEGDLMFMPVTDPAISIDEAIKITGRQDEILKSVPEVEWAVGKAGRAETSTDPSPTNMTETVVHLKPMEEWRKGLTRESLIAELDKKLRMPGVTNIWTQPIKNRIDMLSTGIRSQVGVKVFGNDLKTLEETSQRIAETLLNIPGVSDVYAERIGGAPYIDIHINRVAAARYGIDERLINDTIEKGIGETNLSVTIEGRRRFPVRVRFAPQFRASVQAIGQIPITSSTGATIPLSQLADITQVQGPTMISSENGLLRGTVLLNVRGRDVGSFVDEAKNIITRQVQMPAGYYIEWSGEYENQQRARSRFLLVVPIVLIVIFALLYITYHSALEAAHVLMAVPFALTGGIYLLWFLGYNFSVAVWVGFIALFGTAVQTAVVMVIYLEEAVERKKSEVGQLTRASLMEAVTEGALLRLRPKVMTVSTVVASLLPIMWSTSAGAEVMKPLATPVLGGMLSSLLHVLIVTPVIFFWLRERELKKEQSRSHNGATAVIATMIIAALLLPTGRVSAQTSTANNAIQTKSESSRYLDQTNGMTADEAVAYALTHNGELEAARKEIDAAKAMVKQARLRANPKLDIEGTRQIPPGKDNSVMATAMLPLELGGRRSTRVAVAEREVEVREKEVANRERLLAGEVRMKFGEALAQAMKLSFTDELVDANQQSFNLIAAKVMEGATPPLEQNMALVELNRLKSMRESVAGKIEVSLFELRNLIGMSPEQLLRLKGDFDHLIDQLPPVSEATERALRERPDIQAFRANENLAAARIDQARAEGRLDASLTAGYERMNSSFPVFGLNEHGQLQPVQDVFHFLKFGVSLDLPIRNKNQGAIEAAIADSAAAKSRREFS
ncbi:MAG TPA: CusA/CzcA family heavy metal efflux RND transporter, partial [Pyrinomonadaceae bacterium]|nr:CusA/CzcA family heavy metal efflux RND transporter [Pyrinomonadaceae bacterium]